MTNERERWLIKHGININDKEKSTMKIFVEGKEIIICVSRNDFGTRMVEPLEFSKDITKKVDPLPFKNLAE